MPPPRTMPTRSFAKTIRMEAPHPNQRTPRRMDTYESRGKAHAQAAFPFAENRIRHGQFSPHKSRFSHTVMALIGIYRSPYAPRILDRGRAQGRAVTAFFHQITRNPCSATAFFRRIAHNTTRMAFSRITRKRPHHVQPPQTNCISRAQAPSPRACPPLNDFGGRLPPLLLYRFYGFMGIFCPTNIGFQYPLRH